MVEDDFEAAEADSGASPVAYGIIFVGPPGQFSIWEVTPGGERMSREGVEVLGQMALRAGAADYRVFELELEGEARNASIFASPERLNRFEDLMRQTRGVPAGLR